jgi:YD repeat-containing protein
MPKIITKTDAVGFKYPYAYDSDGNLISIDAAVKIINGEKEKYYLFKDLSFELTLAHGEQRKYWSKTHISQSSEKDARLYNNVPAGESNEHITAKQKIAFEECFIWQGHKIRLKNACIESKIFNSKYYADCKAELLDGTPCVVEVILTSDTSEQKKDYLKKSEILTFEIHIDRNGNTINERFGIYGNGEIERIQTEIASVERSILAGKNEVARIRSEVGIREKEVARGIRDYNQEIEEQLQQMESRFRDEEDNSENGLFQVPKNGGRNAYQLRKQMQSTINEIRPIKQEVSRIEKSRSRYSELRKECETMENTFIQASQRCSLKWYSNSITREPQGKDRLLQLIYWCS